MYELSLGGHGRIKPGKEDEGNDEPKEGAYSMYKGI